MKKGLFFFLLFGLPILSFSQETIDGNIMYDGLSRDYILYVPASYTGNDPAPLVFNFHGYTSTAYEQMFYGDFRSIADTAGFLLVHPMGTVDDYGNTHWNVGWGASTVDDVGFTNALIDALASEYNVDNNRVYCTGMSNGGFMSYKLACELSDRIAAIASVTGTMNIGQFNSCDPQHPMPVMEIHGTADAVVPYNGANWIESTEDVVDFWANFNECGSSPMITDVPDIDMNDGSTVKHFLYSNVISGIDVEHFKVFGGEHTWPGSIFAFPGTNYDIDASAEIWRFFSQYDINGQIITPPTSNNEAVYPDVRMSPNPTNSIVNIELNTTEPLEYYLFNSVGALKEKGYIDSGAAELDLSSFPQGLYYLQLGNKSFKVVKSD